jgi:hypothetical protein
MAQRTFLRMFAFLSLNGHGKFSYRLDQLGDGVTTPQQDVS